MATMIDFSKIPTGTTSQTGGMLRAHLHRMGITTIDEIIKFRGSELLQRKNFGIAMVKMLKNYLESEGYSLRAEEPKQPDLYKTFEVWFRQAYPDVYNCYKCEHEAYRKANNL